MPRKATEKKTTPKRKPRKAKEVIKLGSATELHSWILKLRQDASEKIDLDLKSLVTHDSATIQVLVAFVKQVRQDSIDVCIMNAPENLIQAATDLGMDQLLVGALGQESVAA